MNPAYTLAGRPAGIPKHIVAGARPRAGDGGPVGRGQRAQGCHLPSLSVE
jgi:hypothetical protein